MKNPVKFFALAATSVVMFTGCATSGTHEATEPAQVKLTTFEKVSVTVESQNDEARPQLNTIQEEVTNKLREQFNPIELNKGEKKAGVLGIKLVVVEFNAPGGASHFFLGGLNPDRVGVTGTLYDMGTGRKIGAFKSSAVARLNGIVGGNTGTIRASERLGLEISDLLNGKVSK